MKKILSTAAAMALTVSLLTVPASASCRGKALAGSLLKQALRNRICGGETVNIDPGAVCPGLDWLFKPSTSQPGADQPGTNQPGTSQPDVPVQTPDIPQGGEDGILAFESEVVSLVNDIRAQYGLSALTINQDLCQVARYKSQDMAEKGYFAHESPTYGSPFQMMQSFGISYRTAGENIAYGQQTPQAVVNAWMNSSGHRANILNSSYTQIGVGFYASGYYWTQMFIG